MQTAQATQPQSDRETKLLAQDQAPENKLLCILFFGVLYGFSILTFWSCLTIGNSASESERRRLATWSFDAHQPFSEAARAFERVFNDHFAQRTQLVSAIASARYKWFGTTQSNKVLIGKDGWLFFKESFAEEHLHNDKPFNASELNWWRSRLERRNSWLKSHGIRYLFYVPPLASSIYPEMLPDNYFHLSGPSRLDQLFAYLKTTRSEVEFVDLRPALRAAKQLPIYLKSDSHWNSAGAYVATGPILEKIKQWFPNISLLEPWELQLAPRDHLGDLLLGLGLLNAREKTYEQRPDAYKLWKANPKCYDENMMTMHETFVTTVDNPNLPTAVCIRDSYTIAQRPYLSNHFRRVVYGWWDELPYDVIEREHPDLVLEERVERMIGR